MAYLIVLQSLDCTPLPLPVQGQRQVLLRNAYQVLLSALLRVRQRRGLQRADGFRSHHPLHYSAFLGYLTRGVDTYTFSYGLDT